MKRWWAKKAKKYKYFYFLYLKKVIFRRILQLKLFHTVFFICGRALFIYFSEILLWSQRSWLPENTQKIECELVIKVLVWPTLFCHNYFMDFFNQHLSRQFLLCRKSFNLNIFIQVFWIEKLAAINCRKVQLIMIFLFLNCFYYFWVCSN